MVVLDTDVLIDVLRKLTAARTWLERRPNEEFVIPGFVAVELVQGCRDKIEQDRVHRLVSRYGVVWPSEKICKMAFQLYIEHFLGHNLDFPDAVIGQTAVELGAPLCTFNEKHYRVIPGIKTVRPYER